MLILIGIVPTAYALNRAIPPSETQDFVAVSRQAGNVIDPYVTSTQVVADPRDDVADCESWRPAVPAWQLSDAPPIQEALL